METVLQNSEEIKEHKQNNDQFNRAAVRVCLNEDQNREPIEGNRL
jgi:hypothetical protein